MSKKEQLSLSRRNFIQQVSFASIFLLSGQVKALCASEVEAYRKKVKLRFIVASDIHYGQPNTAFEEMLDKAIAQINQFHAENPLDFCVMNGDIVHDDKTWMPKAKLKIDGLKMPYYVTRGNHDLVSPDYWKDIWGTPLNHQVVHKKVGILLGDTSNEQGKYLCPDLTWLKEQLDAHKKYKQVLVFLHIPQAKWTKHGIDHPEFFDLLKNYPNVKAAFHGHEHDQDGVKMMNNTPFLFDSHIGGSWGTPYKGYRVGEVLNDGTLITYMMNPEVKMEELSF